MKNKIISLVLAVTLFTTSTLQAQMFEKTGSTSYSQWKDPASNITYTNFGSVNFKFKKNVTNFAPWVKLRPPGVKAGCGGVSLDAGFAAFLDLETIGKQLEQAISSVGMGVIVVLIQTMPSIGKAYENIQKLIRKIQSMLQNACQLTVQGLSNDPWVKNQRDNLQDTVDKDLGMDSFNNALEGVNTKIDNFKKSITCSNGDQNCHAWVKSILSGTNPNITESGSVPKSTYVGLDPEISNAINNLYSGLKVAPEDAISVPIIDVFLKKYNGKVLSLYKSDLTAYKIKLAMFGELAIAAGDGYDGITAMKADKSIDTQIAAETLANNNHKSPSFTTNFYPPKNTPDDIAKFLIGVDVNGTATTNSLYIPADLNVVTKILSSSSSRLGGNNSGDLTTFQYLQWKGDSSTANKIAVSWEGIERASYKTILNAVDSSKYPLPANPIGVYMPNGNKFVQIIKKYARKEDQEKYAEFLARLNVRYAVKALVREAKADATSMIKGENKQAKLALQEYMHHANGVEKAVLQKIEDHSGDVVYLNNINQVFENMKQNALQRRMKRVKAQ